MFCFVFLYMPVCFLILVLLLMQLVEASDLLITALSDIIECRCIAVGSNK